MRDEIHATFHTVLCPCIILSHCRIVFGQETYATTYLAMAMVESPILPSLSVTRVSGLLARGAWVPWWATPWVVAVFSVVIRLLIYTSPAPRASPQLKGHVILIVGNGFSQDELTDRVALTNRQLEQKIVGGAAVEKVLRVVFGPNADSLSWFDPSGIEIKQRLRSHCSP